MVGTNFLRALYAGNLLWHASAFIHFSFRQKFMMHKLAKRPQSKTPSISSLPEGDPWHHDIMAYLGYINVGYAVLAGIRLWSHTKNPTLATSETDLDVLALAILGIANASQAWANFVLSAPSGRWIMGTGLDRITVLDALFTILDGYVVASSIIGL
ncbi:hypothetical protein DM02DRAFT_624150 [Periconia macrospinosa]|uniref:Uncharacterized protein n=1 Tax=Periconia macrospinosa TaxID=97972 RepID=A0A2V1E883_9PLEO|nr:hypothetical protein DM02DRAFT_624150 [Periconia macrospinosa]